jgi:3-hydroxyisobutyryl-CoA hydrolase
MSELLEKLVSLKLDGKDSQSISKAVDECIESFNSEDQNTKSSLVAAKRKAIDYCFKYDKMEETVDALQRYAQSSGDLSQWAKETLKTIESKSPTSLKVTLEGIRRGGKMGINEVLQMDMEIGEMFCVSLCGV